MSRFHVGMRVRFVGVDEVHGVRFGMLGVICGFGAPAGDPDKSVQVIFDGHPNKNRPNGYWFSRERALEPINDPSTPNWLEIAKSSELVKDSAISQELGWKRKVSA